MATTSMIGRKSLYMLIDLKLAMFLRAVDIDFQSGILSGLKKIAAKLYSGC
jgi:hypothetical protein